MQTGAYAVGMQGVTILVTSGILQGRTGTEYAVGPHPQTELRPRPINPVVSAAPGDYPLSASTLP